MQPQAVYPPVPLLVPLPPLVLLLVPLPPLVLLLVPLPPLVLVLVLVIPLPFPLEFRLASWSYLRSRMVSASSHRGNTGWSPSEVNGVSAINRLPACG